MLLATASSAGNFVTVNTRWTRTEETQASLDPQNSTLTRLCSHLPPNHFSVSPQGPDLQWGERYLEYHFISTLDKNHLSWSSRHRVFTNEPCFSTFIPELTPEIHCSNTDSLTFLYLYRNPNLKCSAPNLWILDFPWKSFSPHYQLLWSCCFVQNPVLNSVSHNA